MPEWLSDWWPAIALFAAIVSPLMTGWISWSINRRFVRHDDLATEADSRRQALLAIDQRVGALENTVTYLPTREAVHDLSIQMTRLDGRLGSLGEKLEGVEKLGVRMQQQVDMMDDWLRQSKGVR